MNIAAALAPAGAEALLAGATIAEADRCFRGNILDGHVFTDVAVTDGRVTATCPSCEQPETLVLTLPLADYDLLFHCSRGCSLWAVMAVLDPRAYANRPDPDELRKRL